MAVVSAFEWFRANLTPGAIGIYALLAAVIGGYFKFKPMAMKLANEREANLLSERAEEMERMRVRMDAVEAAARQSAAEAERQIALLQAERAIDRHKLNNVTQCLDALILLIEQDPKKASEAATRIKAMRADQMKAEATEKGALSAAKTQGLAA